MDDDDKKDYKRIQENARLLDDLLNEIVKGFYAGEFVAEKEYWQGKKDGLRLAISLLRPHLPGAWISSLRSSPGAIFLESEEKIMDVAQEQKSAASAEFFENYYAKKRESDE